MIIACPHCSTGYLLPAHLLGPGGARVRCPRCHQPFAVDREGEVAETQAVPVPPPGTTTLTEMSPASPPPGTFAPQGPVLGEPLTVARTVLQELASRAGGELEKACAERRLFQEFGPLLMEAFDAYRQQAGPHAGPAPFREALRERWGVELVPLGLPRSGA